LANYDTWLSGTKILATGVVAKLEQLDTIVVDE